MNWVVLYLLFAAVFIGCSLGIPIPERYRISFGPKITVSVTPESKMLEVLDYTLNGRYFQKIVIIQNLKYEEVEETGSPIFPDFPKMYGYAMQNGEEFCRLVKKTGHFDLLDLIKQDMEGSVVGVQDYEGKLYDVWNDGIYKYLVDSETHKPSYFMAASNNKVILDFQSLTTDFSDDDLNEPVPYEDCNTNISDSLWIRILHFVGPQAGLHVGDRLAFQVQHKKKDS